MGWDMTGWILVFMLKQFLLQYLQMLAVTVNCRSKPHFKKTWVKNIWNCQVEQSHFYHTPKGTHLRLLSTSFPRHLIAHNCVGPNYGEVMLTRFSSLKFPLVPKFSDPKYITGGDPNLRHKTSMTTVKIFWWASLPSFLFFHSNSWKLL